jgi:hypothetical protein
MRGTVAFEREFFGSPTRPRIRSLGIRASLLSYLVARKLQDCWQNVELIMAMRSKLSAAKW